MHSYLATSPISDTDLIGTCDACLETKWAFGLLLIVRMILDSVFGNEGGTPQLIGWHVGGWEDQLLKKFKNYEFNIL